MELGDRRQDYQRDALDEQSVAADPLTQFARWYADAEASEVIEANAMTLATADAAGRPSARIVLLKGVSEGGFVFFTDYRSRKGRELASNPHAALVFHWPPLERQVRVTGRVARLSEAESSAYFHTRPVGSRLGAWGSEQSRPIGGRDELVAAVEARRREFAAGEIPLPPHWGGFRLTPDSVEFWQGRPDRLHDRILYSHSTESGWQLVRLSP